jgi:hypothetical protein
MINMIKYIILSALFFISMEASCQNDSLIVNPVDTATRLKINNGPVYKLKLSIDIPVTLISGGWSAYAFSKIYSKIHPVRRKSWL